jgi:hypothetical protein
MAENSDDAHLYYCKRNPMTMKSIDSCTRVQLCSYDDHATNQLGSSTLTANGNNSYYSSKGVVPMTRSTVAYNTASTPVSSTPVSSTGVYTPPTNVASRASYMSSS